MLTIFCAIIVLEKSFLNNLTKIDINMNIYIFLKLVIVPLKNYTFFQCSKKMRERQRERE